MKEKKKMLRTEVLQRMEELSQEEYEQASRLIASHLYEMEEWKQTKVLGITISVNREVSTYSIIEQAWNEGKRVVVPKCNSKTRTMTFYEITSFHQLETVYMNLQEPVTALTKEVSASDIDLLLMPGVAFTKRGDRLGYGGGYYDRFLTQYDGKTVALAFSVQIVPEIPVQEFDQPVQKIITEKQVISCI
ncbi:5-formyltetrahydrofolate cyclo-ligase [Microbacteriaceae bacterium 4G12]